VLKKPVTTFLLEKKEVKKRAKTSFGWVQRGLGVGRWGAEVGNGDLLSRA